MKNLKKKLSSTIYFLNSIILVEKSNLINFSMKITLTILKDLIANSLGIQIQQPVYYKL